MADPKWLRDAIADGRATVRPAATMPGAELVKRKPPDVRTGGRGRWAVTMALACRVVSEANRRDHWTVKRRRAEIQREAIYRAWGFTPIGVHPSAWCRAFPLVVTWAHVGRTMDDDNLRSGFKALRDELARVFGIDDGDPRVEWRYEQRPGKPGVEVRIESAGGK